MGLKYLDPDVMQVAYSHGMRVPIILEPPEIDADLQVRLKAL